MLTLNFKEFPILTTERLVLREHAITDAPTLFKMRTNEEVMRFIHRERPTTVQDIETFIESFNEGYRRGQHIAWVISLKDDPDQMVGSIGYWRTNFPNYRAEIGYMLHPDYWRKGIVSEALKTTIDFGFVDMKLHSIQANINPGNEASRQILLKHDFVKEAYFKEDYYFGGKFLDSEIYSLLNTTTIHFG
ncbi:GNAT family N-acetyltransferase [Pedobacter sp. Du54]|uniref:GNAT family N-acetyltransferase n=1 Tax=Pedobacter anseongensis TaxID=3133439 RepID=UPI00309C2A86